MRGFGALFVFALGLALAGCASTDEANDQNDPFESTNRQIFALNQKLDRYVVAPSAMAYVSVVPEPARTGIHNFLLNLDLPVTFANDVLQGESDRAADTAGRFAVNTTIGLGGLLDMATPMGIPYHSEDFGQTLAVYGVGEGPYLVLPFFGPDPPRDIAGQITDVFLDPFTYVKLRDHIYWDAGRGYFSLLDLRARNLGTLESIERSSVDYYASVRSLYRQLRNNEIRNGRPDVQNLPSF